MPLSRCRAFYEQTEYEAEILEITPDAEGNKYAFVRFAGYGNEETVWLDDIVASHGDEAWQKQAWLPDGYSQTFRLYVFGPSGLMDYGSTMLRCKI